MTTPNQPASDTPRTDAAIRSGRYIGQGYSEEIIDPGFARQLERELAQALNERASSRSQLEVELCRERCTTCKQQYSPSLIESGVCIFCTCKNVTQERDELKAWKSSVEAVSTPKKAIEYILSDPEHNPDNLTPEQVGVADGWRLLKRSEIVDEKSVEWDLLEELQMWLTDGWDKGLNYGSYTRATYRTRLSVAELAALRAKGGER